jgi:tetratricopeptide (TPR) repeat protein
VIMLDHATALWRAGDADEATLVAARDAQVVRRDWEAAAWAECLLANWYAYFAGRGELTDEHLAQAAKYAIQAPLTARTESIDRTRTFRLMSAGKNEEAVSLARSALRRAEGSGETSHVGDLFLLIGQARAYLGDEGGLEDMERGIAILDPLNGPEIASALGNLAEVLRGLGALSRASELHDQARRRSEEFNNPYVTAWLTLEQAVNNYHAGHWDKAMSTAVEHAADSYVFSAASARAVRGHVGVARGDVSGATIDADFLVGQAEALKNAEILLTGLALRALCQDAAGDQPGALTTCDVFIDEWRRCGGLLGRLENLAEIAPILASAERYRDLVSITNEVAMPGRWTDAIVAIAERRFTDAATTYRAIGSQPNEAAAYMLAAQPEQANRVSTATAAHRALAIYQSLGATLYASRAKSVLRQSA